MFSNTNSGAIRSLLRLLRAEARGDRRASVRRSAELSVRLSKARTGIADSRATVVRRELD